MRNFRIRQLHAAGVSGSWAAYYDNTFWEPNPAGNTTWSIYVWDMYQVGGGYDFGVMLDAIGTWNVGLRPTALRFETTAQMESFILKDTLGNDIVNLTQTFAANTLHEIPITGQTNDIDQLIMVSNPSYTFGYDFVSFELYA